MCFRSSLDAILRVVQHAKSVQEILETCRPSVHQRAATAQRIWFGGGLQVHLDIRKAFDHANRSAIITQLFESVPQSLAHLIASWHFGTSYLLFHHDDKCEIPSARGVRRGCKAAPFLWPLLTLHAFQLIAQKVPYEWLCAHVTLYADDWCITATFRNIDSARTQLHHIGRILHILEQIGLEISHTKSHVLLAVGGTMRAKGLQEFQKRTNQGVFLRVPLPNHTEVLLPVTDRVKYLGIIVSIKHSESLTLAHRLDMAQIAFRRLGRWLRSRRLGISTKLHIWRSCVFNVLQYGLLSIGLTAPNLLKLQQTCVGMLRRIHCNHSHHTRQTHLEALALCRSFWPLELLRKAAIKLQQKTFRIVFISFMSQIFCIELTGSTWRVSSNALMMPSLQARSPTHLA